MDCWVFGQGSRWRLNTRDLSPALRGVQLAKRLLWSGTPTPHQDPRRVRSPKRRTAKSRPLASQGHNLPRSRASDSSAKPKYAKSNSRETQPFNSVVRSGGSPRNSSHGNPQVIAHKHLSWTLLERIAALPNGSRTPSKIHQDLRYKIHNVNVMGSATETLARSVLPARKSSEDSGPPSPQTLLPDKEVPGSPEQTRSPGPTPPDQEPSSPRLMLGPP